MALSRLAATRITSFDDGTVESKECNAVFDTISKYVQGKGPWTNNMFRVALPQLTTVPTFGFNFTYQLPTFPLNLRILKVNEDKLGDINYRVENNTILCDEPTLSILYIGLLTNPDSFGPYLEEAIVDHLVAQMAYKFTGQISTQEKFTQYAKENIEHLLNLDGVQGSNDQLPSDTFIEIRLSSGTDFNDFRFF